MKLYHPSMGYIYLKGIWKIVRINCYEHFGFRRSIVTLIVLVFCLVVWLFNTFCRILDELFYRGYRKQELRTPIFIISPPRSGTTFLQRILAKDEVHFFTPSLYQVLFPTIIMSKTVFFFSGLDRLIGSPFGRIANFIGSRRKGVWTDIHKIGLGLPEEDEGLWFLSFLSPAWSLIVPYFENMRSLNVLDDWPDQDKEKIMNFYENFLLRLQYLGYPQSRVLIKSVMSSGRIGMIHSKFPDAQIICIQRHPLKTVPSYISMFSAPWRWHSKIVSFDAYQSVGWSAIDFHNHVKTSLRTLPEGQRLVISFNDLVAKPIEIIRTIYRFLGITIDPLFEAEIARIVKERKSKESRHVYHLADYGYTESGLLNVLK